MKKSPHNLPFSCSSPDIFLHFHTDSVSPSTSYHLSICDSVPHHVISVTFIHVRLTCLCVLSNPVYSTCHHSFCSDCLTKLFPFYSDTSVPCPFCQKSFTFHSVLRFRLFNYFTCLSNVTKVTPKPSCLNSSITNVQEYLLQQRVRHSLQVQAVKVQVHYPHCLQQQKHCNSWQKTTSQGIQCQPNCGNLCRWT